MVGHKVEQSRSTRTDDLSDRIYSQSYNGFATLVEKVYSPRFAKAKADRTMNIGEEVEQEAAKGKKRSRKGKATTFTKQTFITDLKKVSRRGEA